MTVLADRIDAAVGPAIGHAPAGPDALMDAVLRTVAYSDVFDFAPTTLEVHRHLVGSRASLTEVRATLAAAVATGRLERGNDLVTLAGRGGLRARRAERSLASDAAWPAARRYGRVTLAGVPFVRMVAVTGALAAGNAAPGDDIDLMIVTAPGRVWSARLGAVAVARAARHRGLELCPNYFLSDAALALPERDLYAAMELVRMVPLAGRRTYRQLLASNPWVRTLLPNASGAPPGASRLRPPMPRIRTLAERMLRSALGDAAETWEQGRKIRRLRAQAGSLGARAGAESWFSADRCKGHLHGHGARIREAYQARSRALGIDPMWEAKGG